MLGVIKGSKVFSSSIFISCNQLSDSLTNLSGSLHEIDFEGERKKLLSEMRIKGMERKKIHLSRDYLQKYERKGWKKLNNIILFSLNLITYLIHNVERK